MSRSVTHAVGGIHWPELDGLRALAILLVLARHSLRPFISEDTYQPVVVLGSLDLTPALLNGWVGVDLFFVLSGFLIGRQALRGTDTLGRFCFKRVTRILPAYWTCLAIVGVWLTLSAGWSGRVGDFFAHVMMLQDYTGSVFVAAFWSLGAEEKFYLLTPLIALALARVNGPLQGGALLLCLWAIPPLARAAACVGASCSPSYEQYFPMFRSPFHLTAESLILGFGVAWLTVNGHAAAHLQRRSVRELLFWSGVLSLSYALVTTPLLVDIDVWTIVWAPALLGLGFGTMVLACVSGPGSYSALLTGRAWRALSTGSYTLYLTHMMILPLAVALATVSSPGSRGTVLYEWMSFLPWYLGLSATSAFLLHRLVERPILGWRNRILRVRPSAGKNATGRHQLVITNTTPSVASTASPV